MSGPTAIRRTDLVLAHGAVVDVVDTGEGDRGTVVFHHGAPSAAVIHPRLAAAVAAARLRLILFSRPGYSSSTPAPGRTIADNAAITSAVLDALGVDEFVSLGWSGGGPHALADGAVLRGRCRGVATLASIAPYGASDLDWLSGMADENLVEFGAAIDGPEALDIVLEGLAPELADVEAGQVTEALGGLLSEADKRSIDGPTADFIAAASRRSVARGADGWRDDDLAFIKGWGFTFAAIDVPVSLWHGEQDYMVPASHGRWLSARLSTVLPHICGDDGHVSLWRHVAAALEEITAR